MVKSERRWKLSELWLNDKKILTMAQGETLKTDCNCSENTNSSLAEQKSPPDEMSLSFSVDISREQYRKILKMIMDKGSYNAMVLREDGHLGPDNCW